MILDTDSDGSVRLLIARVRLAPIGDETDRPTGWPRPAPCGRLGEPALDQDTPL